MISFIVNNFPLRRKWIYFSERPSLKSGLFSYHKNSLCTQNVFGFKRVPSFTKLIDLRTVKDKDSLGRHNLKKIRRAESDGVECCMTADRDAFVSFYNDNIYDKKLSGSLTAKSLEIYGESLLISCANYEGCHCLVFHSYLLDYSIRRVRVFHSISATHDDALTSLDKSFIGRANRYLHFADMLYFKELGFLKYDLGGYAYQTDDPSLEGINTFKDTFGGELVEESNYESYIIYAFKSILMAFRRLFKQPPVHFKI